MQASPSLFAAGLIAFATTALAAPAGVADCADIDAGLARADEARRAAQEQSENAWKAVVPFVVLARKASAKSALAEAERQLAELKAMAVRCESADGR